MMKCGVLFEVRTEFLNNIQTSFVFKGLNQSWNVPSNRGKTHQQQISWKPAQRVLVL
jgi:hypothetical protein